MSKLILKTKEFIKEKSKGSTWLEHEFIGKDQFGRAVHGDGILTRIRYHFDNVFAHIQTATKLAKSTDIKMLDWCMELLFKNANNKRDQIELSIKAATPDEIGMLSGENETLSPLWDELINHVDQLQLDFIIANGDVKTKQDALTLFSKIFIFVDL